MTDGPHHGQSSTGPAARAADPNTPQVQLHMLAGDHPELRPLIAENPNTYPELLQWLAGLGDPAVDAALARRAGAGGSAAADEQSTTMLPAAGRGPTQGGGTDEFSAVQDPSTGYDQASAEEPVPQQPGYEQGHAEPRGGYYPAAPGAGAPWQAPPAGGAHPAGYPPSGYPAGSYPAEREEEPRRRGGGTCAIIFLILLVAAAAVVAAYFLIFGGALSGDDEETGQDTVSQGEVEGDQPAPEDAEEPGAEGEGTTEEEADEDSEDAVRPAPEDAQDIPAFTAPSGNINCAINEDEVECSIIDYTFDTPEDCDGPARLSLASEEPQLGCGETPGTDSATLQYGQSASNGRFACVSSESGFECWNTETGNGFFMARQSYQLQD
ncbi:hypothetical protein [Nesterenkonia lutea]|uniref:Leucine rich repeat variant domain-containing protein n=1 Tax=Nesterenkonia lutea TaxID=272919 RepID=A0ABR9JF40_9MICC|nr:hypothetical protein [Nesterenkonia lutea]MBE1524539.1 hypothetical protein [Nesterenkonia lutea]